MWEYDFPPVYGHTSIAYLKHCPGFEEAKRGDMQAALEVVNICIKPSRIAELKKKYANAILLPVITDNKLPEALAQKIGMTRQMAVYEQKTQSRKTLSGMERLLHRPCFSGKIIEGAEYIIVDDVVTQGGTISALRKHVICNGGSVVAVTALAYSTDSQIIAPDIHDMYDLTDRFNTTRLNAVLKEYDIADDICELTRSQIRYLLRFKKLESISNRMVGCVM